MTITDLNLVDIRRHLHTPELSLDEFETQRYLKYCDGGNHLG